MPFIINPNIKHKFFYPISCGSIALTNLALHINIKKCIRDFVQFLFQHAIMNCDNFWTTTFTKTRCLGWGVKTTSGSILPDILQYADVKSKLPPSGCLNQRPLTDVNCHVCTRARDTLGYRGRSSCLFRSRNNLR